MKIKISALSIMVLLGFASCATHMPQAPTINGEPIVIKVVIEDNIQKEMDTVQVQRYSQVAAWMSSSLLENLQRSGYQPELLAKQSDFQAADGTFLLVVKIEKYNFRAVGTFLETSYILTGKQQLLSNKHSCSTARNWRNCVKKLNKDMIDDVTRKMQTIDAQN